jgi:hypothetical protein
VLRRVSSIGIAILAAVIVLAGPAQADTPAPAIVTGLDAGWPDVRGWSGNGRLAHQWAPWGEWDLAFSPYPTYQQGVRVAVGDVNGDGRPEIVTAPGKDAFTELKVFDGRTFRLVESLLPFKDAAWWAGAYVATGDTNGDGRDEIIDGLDAGCCTTLHVLDGSSGNEVSGFFPYGNRSEVGARVASADLSGDGKAELLAVPIGSTRIEAYAPNGGSPFRTIDAFGSEVTGPMSIAAGNLIGDARAEIVAAAPTYSGAEVKIVDAVSGETSSVVYPYGGVSVSSLGVALGDVDGDGTLDVILSAVTPGGTEVQAIDASGSELAEFYVLDPAIVPGASIAAGDLDGDGRAEIVLGGGPTNAPWPPVANGPDQRVAVYEANGTQVGEFSAYPGLFQGGVRVALADLNHDRRPELITAPGPGMEPEIGIFSQQWVNGRDRGTRLGHFLAFEPTFRGGATVASGDVDGDGDADIVTGAGKSHAPEIRVFDEDGQQLFSFLAFGGVYDGGVSVATGDLNGDGRAEIVAGSLAPPARIRVFDRGVPEGPVMTPFAAGAQVGVADLSGNARGVIIAGETSGEHPRLALIDPQSGAVLHSTELSGTTVSGIRVSGGDLNADGRDEIVVSSGFGGDSRVHVFDAGLVETNSFAAYDWPGAGTNVAVATRVGFPIAAQPRTVKLKAGKRTRFVIARFRDAGGGTIKLNASIAWGDGTSWSGTVLVRGGGVYDVRSTKRYGRPGRHSVSVTVTDPNGRTSIARSHTIVSRR